MVCRENKGRSANIGMAKALHFAMTGERLHDAELQSMQHQYRHEVEAAENFNKYEGFDSWPPKDQIAAWRNLLTHVEEIPEDVLSERAKYRESHKQPGIGTRIRQEIARLETNRHEGTGRRLNADQRNTGADMLATMRMSASLERLSPSRKNFLESNARRRGITFAQAESEWSQLMNRKGDFSNISLTDDFRDRLAVAGVDAQDQANLGQSGRARAAMQVMEGRASEHLKTLKTRPGLRAEHSRGTWIKPGSPEAQIRCEDCGQFGHTNDACPNGEHVEVLGEAAELSDTLDQHGKILARKKMLDEKPEAELQAVFDKAVPGMTVAQYKADLAAEEDKLGGPLLDEARIQKLRSRIEKDTAAAQAAIDASAPKVSNWVKEVSYNPDNGYLRVVQHPYTNAKGETKEYVRHFRARPEDVDAILANPHIGKGVHASLLDSNTTRPPYEFENEADLQAAQTEMRCPTCGQWASLNSSHRCPVPGGPSEEFDVERRRKMLDYQAQARAARQNGTAKPPKPMGVEQCLAHDNSSLQLQDPADKTGERKFAGTLRSGKKADINDALDRGNLWTSSVAFSATNEDCHVTGEVSAWSDESGVRVLSVWPRGGSRGLKCTCPAYVANRHCPHVTAVAKQLLNKYEAKSARPSSRPGMSQTAIAANRAEDGSVLPPSRLGYAEIAKRRADATNAYAFEHVQRRKAAVPPGQWVQGPARDPQTGEPVDTPDSWDRNPAQTKKVGKPVDLSDVGAVRDRLRQLSQSKGSRGKRLPFSVKLDPDGSGAILVNIPPGTVKKGNEALIRQQRRQLADLMGVSEKAIGVRGYRVSPNKAARYNALDRMAGDPARITPPTVSYVPSQQSVDGAFARHRSGNDGEFVGV
ncbi:UNVERIFIED_ORG: hypothetical protein EDC92_11737 [Dietzia maris]